MNPNNPHHERSEAPTPQTFQELIADIQTMKASKHHQAKAYYQKHFGKETFRPAYYEELKDDYAKIEKLEQFFNHLSDDSLLLFVVLECLRRAKEHRKNDQLIEYIQLWIPLVPKVQNLGNFYFINLVNS
jgi:hypothetical protein